MSRSVLIRGDGVAARCCAHLLSRFGISCETASRPAGAAQPAPHGPRPPALLLSRTALDLLRDVFEQPGLLSDLPLIRSRVVQWGSQPAPLVVEHAGVVVSEDELLDRLGNAGSGEPAADPEWTIFASDSLPEPSVSNRFGERDASVSPVALAESADPSSCWIESLENGWLFLIGGGHGQGWLLSVGEPELEASRLVARQIACCADPVGHFAAGPRILSPICGPGWLACGSSAMAFDPLCGDGAAHAVREAILACAVIRASAGGTDPAPLLDHYAARLTAGFERHLSICLQYYCSGGRGVWWNGQGAATRCGMDWCSRKMVELPPFRYRLTGYDLVPILRHEGVT
jgi:hypothetical protein